MNIRRTFGTVVFKVDEDKIFLKDFTLSTDRRFICAHKLSLGRGVVRLGVALLRWLGRSYVGCDVARWLARLPAPR
jgi:hypothetical protein